MILSEIAEVWERSLHTFSLPDRCSDDFVLCFLGHRHQTRESIVIHSGVRARDDFPAALPAVGGVPPPAANALSWICIAALAVLCLSSSPSNSCIPSNMCCVASAASAMFSPTRSNSPALRYGQIWWQSSTSHFVLPGGHSIVQCAPCG